jgi:hypothetical protein
LRMSLFSTLTDKPSTSSMFMIIREHIFSR